MFQDILWFCTVLRRQKTFTTERQFVDCQGQILSFWPPLVKWGRIVGINLDTERWSQKMMNYARQNISHFAICKFWMVQQWSQMVGKANVNQSLKFQPMSNFELNEWSRNHWRRCTMLLHEAEECKNISRHWKRNRFVKLYFCWVLIFLFFQEVGGWQVEASQVLRYESLLDNILGF